MKEAFILKCESNNISLRTAAFSDCDNLRVWKNSNRYSFFFQQIITPEMQLDWFRGYAGRMDDTIFIVEVDGEAIGCMGYRLIEGSADIYNVILGKSEFGSRGLMSQALQLMCSYILAAQVLGIGLKVLKSNPAVRWYLRNGFVEVADRENYLELRLDHQQFDPCGFRKVDLFQPESNNGRKP